MQQKTVLENITTMPHADGEVGFYQACRRNRPGALCNPVFINVNGDEISGPQAHGDYMKYHQLKFGALTIATATALLNVPALEVRKIIAFSVEKPTSEHHWIELAKGIYGLEASVGQIKQIALNGTARTIYLAAEGTPSETADTPSDRSGAVYTQSYPKLNANGIHGEGQKIGLMEGLAGKCEIAPHEAFSEMSIVHQVSVSNPIACQTDADCNNSNVLCTYADNNSCLAGKCYGKHASQVLSRIGAKVDDENHHASRSEIYIANNFFGGTQSIFDVVTNYGWFASNDVRLVNESYAYVDLNAVGNSSNFFSTAKNAAADWFARYQGITFVQSAGNNLTDAPSGDFVLCQQLNGICVGSVEDKGTLPSKFSTGYNGAYLNDVMANDSRWKNPRIDNNGSVFDPGVERPDVVSQGEGVWVAAPNTESNWEKTGGTSFAAPVITGLIALEKQLCGSVVTDHPVVWRSRLRNRAGRAHTLESAPSFYPLQYNDTGFDWKGGAGIPYSRKYSSDCKGSEDPNGGSGSYYSVDELAEEWNDAPEWMFGLDIDPTTYQIDESNLDGAPGVDDLVIANIMNNGNLFPTKTRIHKVFKGLKGDDVRIRASTSFLNCVSGNPGSPASFTSVNDLSASVSFDIALCGVDTQDCYAASYSYGDTNEGFDILLENNPSDELAIYLVARWDTNSDRPLGACGFEPISTHWAYWR